MWLFSGWIWFLGELCNAVARSEWVCNWGKEDYPTIGAHYASKEALNSRPWLAGNLSNKSNIPKAVEKSYDHVFFNICHFCSDNL